MNFNAEDHYRSAFKERLSSGIKDLEKDSANMRTSAMLLAEAREENEIVNRALEDQEKELQIRRERLRERAENVKKEEEKLRQYKLDTAKELQENEARRLRAIQKRKEEEAKIKEKEENIKKLMTQYEALLADKEQLDQRKLLAKLHQESTAKMHGKFENTGRHRDCHGAQSIRKEILERQANEKKAEHKKLELMKDIKEQQTRLLHYTKQLQQQQTELDNIRSETHKWELKREELRSTAEREELQHAQIKIRKHFQLVRAIAEDRNVMTTPSGGTEEDDRQQRLRSKL
ncbi:coiled-coil domain-containing protein 42 like-2-like isoform X2 [Onychostoma macrolepis]|uniref:coiled-coil domain-containing protein 42 like-2-like isoform X2 n=1 Tax=Onychostoma macrolepis TaxID=369639 RepID=UPI00272AB5BE|nr:coiled-coil domain-containing protein 42 like-2-like isoform X2 [Onychostoma macrolepis]